MIRATLDTNVLVSALLFGGTPGRLLDLHTDEAFILCISESIIAELRRILVKRFEWTEEDIESTLRWIVTRAELIEPMQPVSISRDPNDDHILACALEAKADVIVSGDNDLLQIGGFEGIAIITPRQFLDRLVTER